MDDWQRFDSQFAETESERNERLRKKRLAKKALHCKYQPGAYGVCRRCGLEAKEHA